MNREPLPASAMMLPGDMARLLEALLYSVAALEDNGYKRGFTDALRAVALGCGLVEGDEHGESTGIRNDRPGDRRRITS